MHFLESFSNCVEQFPNNLAVFHQRKTLNYHELWNLSFQIASIIKDDSRDWVGVSVHKNSDLIPALLACWITGKGYVPLHPSYPRDRIDFILQNADIQTIIYPNESVVSLGEQEIPFHKGSTIRFRPCTDKSKPAYLLFTSGSTGKPKGVPIFHEQLSAFIEAVNLHKPNFFTPNDRFLQMFEYTFDLSVFSTFFPLCHGASVYLLPNEGIPAFNIAELLEEQEITVALMVPSVLNYFRKYFEEMSFPHLRYNLFCGEALKLNIVKEWKNCVPNAVIENVYGPTEATIFCSAYALNEHLEEESLNGIVPIGKPLPGVYMWLDELELIIGGSQVTTGYFQNPSKSQEVFFEKSGIQMYRSGDLCALSERGNYQFLERKDFQVKIDGYRIELSEIEKVAEEITNVNCVALAVPNGQGGFQLYLFHTNQEIPNEKIQSYLQRKLPPYMLPKSIICLPQFPLNLSGKIDRKELANHIPKI